MDFRRFFITFAATAALASVAHADNTEGAKHKLSGEVRTRFHAIDNYDGTDSRLNEIILNRARLNIDIMPLDTLQVRITPQFTHYFGSHGAISNNKSKFSAHEAWMAWMPTDSFSVYVGRQVWNFGKGLVIGKKDWGSLSGTTVNQEGQKFDNVRLVYKHGISTANFFYVKLNECNGALADGATNCGAAINKDYDLTGLYYVLDFENDAIDTFDVHAIWHDNRATSSSGLRDRVLLFGARLAGNVSAFDYAVEVADQWGKRGTDEFEYGFLLDLDAGYTFMDAHRVGLNVSYSNAEYRNYLGTTHDFVGYSDVLGEGVLGRQNLLAFALRTAFKLHDQFKATLDGHLFMRGKKDVNAGGIDLSIANTNKRLLGYEGNLVLSYMPESLLTFDLGYNLFKGAGALKDLGADEVRNEVYVSGTLTF